MADGERAGDGGRVLYDDLAPWWPLFSAPADYAEEVAHYTAVRKGHCVTPPRTLLELGSGGGNNASPLKHAFRELTLVDRPPGMLAASRALNPECEHREGDMPTIRQDRRFDCVCVHDAICYATTLDDVRRVVETVYVHCEPGGAALFTPDFVRESFCASTEHGGHDAADGRGARYLEWTWDPDPGDTTYVADYAILTREADGTLRIYHDQHVEGLFATGDWTSILADVGFVPHALTHRHPDVSYDSVSFLGVKPTLPGGRRPAMHTR